MRRKNGQAVWVRTPAGRAKARCGALVLALLFLLAGCGGQPAASGPVPDTSGKKPAEGRLVFGPETPWDIRAARTMRFVYRDAPQAPIHELGLFDLTGDGSPELMEFGYGAWSGSCNLYDLAGREPVWLGSITWPPADPVGVWSRPTEGGTAWRVDFNAGHSVYLIHNSEMIFPAEDGVHFVSCCENITAKDMQDWEPAGWSYTVEHRLVREGETQFSRTEEQLDFWPDEDLAALREEDPERAAGLLPASEMEQILEGSLYRQLLEDGWTGTAAPWVMEQELGPDGGGWMGLDLAERCRRLYVSWETRQADGAAVIFAPGEAYIDRALKLLVVRHGSFAQELGLFDIDEDGAPELMVITYGTWMRGFELYRLSGPAPVSLGWHWGPDPTGPAWARQTETGKIWRLDGNYSHGRERLLVSELFVPTERGLRVWCCGEDSDLFETAPYSPSFWRYWVEQSLFDLGRTVFSQRREETLTFPTDELLESRAALYGEDRPAEEQLKENEYPIAEMEERLAASLYQELLSGDWTEVPRPWLTESDVYESNNWDNWLGFDLRTRLRRLYAAWEEMQGKAA